MVNRQIAISELFAKLSGELLMYGIRCEEKGDDYTRVLQLTARTGTAGTVIIEPIDNLNSAVVIRLIPGPAVKNRMKIGALVWFWNDNSNALVSIISEDVIRMANSLYN